MEAAFDGAPDWQTRARLRDGGEIVIRPIRPADREGLRAGYHAASARTRYLRFMTVSGELSEAALTYLTAVDQKDHVALVAIVVSPDDGAERGVGVARFVRLPLEPNVAEAAVTVVDEAQRRGVGRALAFELARAARVRGIDTLRAEVLDGNEVMRTILRSVGARPVLDGGASGAGATTWELDVGRAIAAGSG